MGEHEALDRAIKFLYADENEANSASQKSGRPKQKRPRAAESRHNRKCSVCRHHNRESIEQDFLHWRSPVTIAREYGIADHSSVYRHAHATGLFARRASHIKLALAPLIEKAMLVSVTADSVVRAVVAFAHLNDHGQWVEPPRRVIHESPRPAGPQELPDAASGPSARQPSQYQPLDPNRQTDSSRDDATR